MANKFHSVTVEGTQYRYTLDKRADGSFTVNAPGILELTVKSDAEAKRLLGGIYFDWQNRIGAFAAN